MEMNDKEYLHQKKFAAERFCGIRQAAIKGHPKDFYLTGPHKQQRWIHKEQRTKCLRGAITKFHRFIFVVRNPADAIWANFQLQKSTSHVGKILLQNFNASKWQEFLLDSARAWGDQWSKFVLPTKKMIPASDFIILRYEDMLNSEKREGCLSRLMEFMNYTVSETRLRCAFILSDNQSVHRPSTYNASHVSIGYAYYKSIDPSVLCQAHGYLRDYMNYINITTFAPTLKHQADRDMVPTNPIQCS